VGPSRIEVTGDTDLAGTSPYNQRLSERRAETVRDYIVAHGVARDDIQITALGKTDPAIPTADGVREPRNRRVEIVITPRNAPMAQTTQPPFRGQGMPPADQGATPAGYAYPPPPRNGIMATPVNAPVQQPADSRPISSIPRTNEPPPAGPIGRRIPFP